MWKVEGRDNLYRIGYDFVAETKAWDHIGIVSDGGFDRLSPYQKRFSEDVNYGCMLIIANTFWMEKR